MALIEMHVTGGVPKGAVRWLLIDGLVGEDPSENGGISEAVFQETSSTKWFKNTVLSTSCDSA